MRDFIELVREFHAMYGQAVADAPHVNDGGLNEMRISLLDEELEELAVALQHRDPVATLDALTDLQYVLDGAYLALGFHGMKDAALAEVHRSNMSKLGEDGRPVYRADGKILKGPNYSPPNLRAVIDAWRRTSRVNRFKAAYNDNTPAFDDEPTTEFIAPTAATRNATSEPCAECRADAGEFHAGECSWSAVLPASGEGA